MTRRTGREVTALAARQKVARGEREAKRSAQPLDPIELLDEPWKGDRTMSSALVQGAVN
jgi:hypothetical protein